MVLWSIKVLLPFSNILTTRITVARSPHPLCERVLPKAHHSAQPGTLFWNVFRITSTPFHYLWVHAQAIYDFCLVPFYDT